MGFRTLEIDQAAELHIKNGQLEVATAEGLILIPIEDLNQIMVHGANIRLSTMDLSLLSRNCISLVTLDDKYLPTAIVLPFEGNARQSKLMHAQANMDWETRQRLWTGIIRQKVSNQARALTILGNVESDVIVKYIEMIRPDNVDQIEAAAAKDYFARFHKGLNRRTDDPVNSRLNYGYAIVRSYIARSLVAVGFHPAFGLHHDNQLNAFNLADDLIEPFRAIVDLTAYNNINSNIQLTRQERREITSVLHNACVINGIKANVMTAADMMAESLKRIILKESDEMLLLPTVIPVEQMEGITE